MTRVINLGLTPSAIQIAGSGQKRSFSMLYDFRFLQGRSMRLKGTLTVTALLLILALALFALVISSVFSPSRDEVMRVNSPSGQLVAVVYELNGGATTSFAYEVEIEDAALLGFARKVAYTYDAIRNNKGSYGVVPRWVSDEELHIQYFSSRHDEVFSPYTRLLGSPVKVEMKLNINDSAAPTGGMLDNQEESVTKRLLRARCCRAIQQSFDIRQSSAMSSLSKMLPESCRSASQTRSAYCFVILTARVLNH